MKDKCVTCGVDSIYDFDEYIKFRIGYIVGVGQLCLNCYDKIYFKNKNKEVPASSAIIDAERLPFEPKSNK